MARREKRGEINGMSYGKLMTSLLIPKDARSNPRRVISGIAFIAFVAFFVFGAMSRSCQQGAVGPQDETPPAATSTTEG